MRKEKDMDIICRVKNQELKVIEPETIIEGSVQYLRCIFCFASGDWDGAEKTAYFRGTDGKRYNAILQNDTCIVPWEAVADSGDLIMSVAGTRADGTIITTSKYRIRIGETICGGDPGKEPSPDQYEQIMQALAGKINTAQGAENAGKMLGIGEDGSVRPVEQSGGDTVSVVVESTTTGDPGTDASVENIGTDQQVRLVFAIPRGQPGEKGDQGETGPAGKDGEQGPEGTNGKDGITPTIGENGNWYLGETDTGKPSRGEPGPEGPQGGQGPAGSIGATPNIKIGDVQTLDPGQQATASMTGTPENPLLNLGIPKGENGDSETTVQQMQNTDTTVTLQPNILYIFPEMATLDVTIPETDQEIHFFFDSGATATTFSLRSQGGGQIYTDAYSIDANMRYEVSVLHNVAYIKGVSMSET